MKRCLTAFLLILVLLQCGGLWWCYKVSINNHRKSQKEAVVEDSKLEVFEFSEVEFKSFLVDSHELQIQGLMYDIKKIQENDGQVKVWAALDNHENELIRMFSSLLDEERNPEIQSIVDFSLLAFVVEENLELTFFDFSVERDSPILAESFIGSKDKGCLSPPPEVLEVI